MAHPLVAILDQSDNFLHHNPPATHPVRFSIPIPRGATYAPSEVSRAAPAPLFRVDSEIENYDATADGSRFLVSMPSEKVRESPIRVILNWPAALEKEK